MADDICVDCEGHFPFGRGLKDGRCKSCAAGLRERRAEARAAAEPAVKPESEPEPESE